MRQKKKYVVVSRRKDLYDDIRGVILRDSPASDVINAVNLKEAFRILNGFEESGVLLTDVDAAEEVLKTDVEYSLYNPDAETPARGNSKNEVAFIKMYIRTHLDDDLSLNSLAQKISLSPNYLCVLFRKVEGISVRQFIENARLERAAYMLTTENALMSEIAERVGYRHCSYFCKMFRKHYGTTPKHYRKMHTKAERTLR